MRKVSVIVPIYNLSGDRSRNFNFVLDRLINSYFHEVIVVEQIPFHKAKSELKLSDKVRHLIVHSGSNVIEKSRLMNYGVQQCTGEFMMMNDADIHFQYHIVIPMIHEDDVFVNPFRYFIHLNNAQSEMYIKNQRVTVINANGLNALGAGAYIMRKKEYEACRGMDEAFVGWGYEDSEFGDRVRHLFPIRTLDHIEGCHLYHPHRMRLEPATIRERNYRKYVDNIALLKKSPIDALERMESPFPLNKAFFA